MALTGWSSDNYLTAAAVGASPIGITAWQHYPSGVSGGTLASAKR